MTFWKKITFNHVLALVLVFAFVGFIAVGAALSWDNKIADMATGAFISNLTLVVQFYFRKKPETPPTEGK